MFLELFLGWAGSDGKDMCACGVTGTCQGKAGSKCNCDAELRQWLNDYSYIQNKKRLPVCRVCATLKKSRSWKDESPHRSTGARAFLRPEASM